MYSYLKNYPSGTLTFPQPVPEFLPPWLCSNCFPWKGLSTYFDPSHQPPLLLIPEVQSWANHIPQFMAQHHSQWPQRSFTSTYNKQEHFQDPRDTDTHTERVHCIASPVKEKTLGACKQTETLLNFQGLKDKENILKASGDRGRGGTKQQKYTRNYKSSEAMTI